MDSEGSSSLLSRFPRKESMNSDRKQPGGLRALITTEGNLGWLLGGGGCQLCSTESGCVERNQHKRRCIHLKLCVLVCGVLVGSYSAFVDLFKIISELLVKHFLRSTLHADTDRGVQTRCGGSDLQFLKL